MNPRKRLTLFSISYFKNNKEGAQSVSHVASLAFLCALLLIGVYLHKGDNGKWEPCVGAAAEAILDEGSVKVQVGSCQPGLVLTPGWLCPLGSRSDSLTRKCAHCGWTKGIHVSPFCVCVSACARFYCTCVFLTHGGKDWRWGQGFSSTISVSLLKRRHRCSIPKSMTVRCRSVVSSAL